ncbi:hypothetical protein H5410_057172 [Solanum commersonii]|uniref:Uncharacterized protein n=1 Tax=Solanum commersonii TaxID=4109 RepID=A0A9J5WQ49_SOLCO|nr:hypothetical protein H5410_057172 [Solanum commersonii]
MKGENNGEKLKREKGGIRDKNLEEGKDNMSSTQRSGKAVASSSRKRVRMGITIPPAPAVPRG